MGFFDDMFGGGSASGAASGAAAGSSFGPWGTIIGGTLGFLGGQEQNEANSAQSQAQMDFQREMSNTAYQRAVADMKAAGLNPMLAYSQGGASSPGGSQAVMQNTAASAAAGAQSAASVDLTKATTEKTLAEATNTEAEAQARIAALRQQALTGVSTAAHTDRLAEQAQQTVEAQTRRYEGMSARERFTQDYYKALGDKRYYFAGEPNLRGNPEYRDPRVDVERAHERHLTAQAILEELEQPRFRAEAGFWRDVGKGGVYADRGASVLGRLGSSAGSIGLRLPRR